MGAADPNPTSYHLTPFRIKRECGNLAMRLDVLGDVPALDPFEIFWGETMFPTSTERVTWVSEKGCD